MALRPGHGSEGWSGVDTTPYQWPTAAMTAPLIRPRPRTSPDIPAGSGSWPACCRPGRGSWTWAGIPATRELTAHGLQVLGVDFSAVQLRRAQRLVPAASLVQADMTELQLQPASVDAVVSFYALIHVPLPDQEALFPRIRRWLRPGGHFLATVGADRWTGTEQYLGATMFWDHADTDTYLHWLEAAGLAPIWHRRIPEGESAHSLVLARAM